MTRKKKENKVGRLSEEERGKRRGERNNSTIRKGKKGKKEKEEKGRKRREEKEGGGNPCQLDVNAEERGKKPKAIRRFKWQEKKGE